MNRAVCGMLFVLLFAAITAGTQAETYVNLGTLHMDNQMYESPGVLLNENGGQVQYIQLMCHYAVSFTADPLSQQVLYEWPKSYSPTPSATWDESDGAGNLFYVTRWGQQTDSYPGTLTNGLYWIGHEYDMEEDLILNGMASNAVFPVASWSIPSDVRPYLQPGPKTQSTNAAIIALAQSLISGYGYTKQHEAVNAVVKWVDRNLLWTANTPVDALAVINDPLHRTNCSGFSNTAIALLRAVGIPARFLSGLSVVGDYRYYFSPTLYTNSFGWNQSGSHAWIDVYFPDVGWIPYDPQQMYNYVDSEYCRNCMGLDSATCYYWFYEIAYWPPVPGLTDASIFDSVVSSQSGSLHYRTIYMAPYGLPASGTDAQRYGFSDLVMAYPVDVPEDLVNAQPSIRVCGGNPTGRIVLQCSVGSNQAVRATVYDLRGRVIQRVEGFSDHRGECRLEWPGTDWRGRMSPSGAYLVCVQGRDWSRREKVCLVR